MKGIPEMTIVTISFQSRWERLSKILFGHVHTSLIQNKSVDFFFFFFLYVCPIGPIRIQNGHVFCRSVCMNLRDNFAFRKENSYTNAGMLCMFLAPYQAWQIRETNFTFLCLYFSAQFHQNPKKVICVAEGQMELGN